MKPQEAVVRETKHIALGTLILALVMLAVFALTGNFSLAVLLGPLGRPTTIEKVGRVVVVGGGIGVAPMHPIAKAFKEAGSQLTCIVGARSKELVILEDRDRKSVV